MNGFLTLLLLIITSALPAIIAFLWFHAVKSTVTLTWFLAALAAGIISLSAAAFIQRSLPLVQDGLWQLYYGLFVRIALIEEASRIVTLIPLLIIANRMAADKSKTIGVSFAAALGLASGLGFAIMENAFHGISDLGITLLRAFTAAPLHGACGIRVGIAVSVFTQHKGKAIFYFALSVLIHGAYNLIIVSPAFHPAFALLIAFSALIASLHRVK